MSTFWLSLLALSFLWLVYIYVGYPAILYVLSRQLNRGLGAVGHGEPSVTILTAAYNEEQVVAACIENKLALDYPSEKLEIIVISDGSTDSTEDTVAKYTHEYPGRVRLIQQRPRQGKTAGLNLAVPEARGEVLVFADANSIYEESALRHLMKSLDDDTVGYVTGKMIYTNPDGSITGDGCTAYMRYENRLRELETKVGSVIGVDGGIDAVRKSIYRPMRADELPDFVLPLRVVEQGFRVTYQPNAVLKEPALDSSQKEYRMRVRVTLRALWALHDLRHLLNPFSNFLFSWQLASHKLLRYTAFVPQILAFVANAALVLKDPAFRILLAGQVVFYALAVAGYLLSRFGRSFPLATFPYYLTLLNAACGHACFKFLRGQRQTLWRPRTG